jgi:hypothetical protein
MTATEALAKQLLRTERQEQALFRQWLDLHQVPYYNPRGDKRSTVTQGLLGFCVVYDSRALLIEMKTARGRLSPEQVMMTGRVDAHRHRGASMPKLY